MTIKELTAKRLQIHEQMKTLIKKADDEKRSMTAEEDEQFKRMDADINALRVEIDRREKVEAEEKALAAPANGGTPQKAAAQEDGQTTEERQKKESQAFRAWIRGGFDNLNPEQRAIMARRRDNDVPAASRDYTPQTVTTTGGGYLVPQGFSGELEKALKAFGGVRSVARSFPTPSGHDIPWPTVDDTANVGELVAINTPAAGQQVAYGQVTLKAFKFSSKAVLVPLELLQDSFFDIEAHLNSLLAERIGRILNQYFTTGTGNGQPQGVTIGCSAGVTGAVGTNQDITFDGLVDLEHSLDPAYRMGASYMMNDLSLAVVKKLVDNYGRPLWLPSVAGGAPDTILNKPYVINQDMANMSAGAISALFGNFSRYIVRDVMPFTLVRIAEKYIESGQIAFLAWSRHDGRCINTAAIKKYVNGAAS